MSFDVSHPFFCKKAYNSITQIRYIKIIICQYYFIKYKNNFTIFCLWKHGVGKEYVKTSIVLREHFPQDRQGIEM
jgi:hypothetical protein